MMERGKEGFCLIIGDAARKQVVEQLAVNWNLDFGIGFFLFERYRAFSQVDRTPPQTRQIAQTRARVVTGQNQASPIAHSGPQQPRNLFGGKYTLFSFLPPQMAYCSDRVPLQNTLACGKNERTPQNLSDGHIGRLWRTSFGKKGVAEGKKIVGRDRFQPDAAPRAQESEKIVDDLRVAADCRLGYCALFSSKPALEPFADGFEPEIAALADSPESLIGMAAAGRGVFVGPDIVICGREETWKSAGDIYPLSEPGSYIELFTIWKKQSQVEPTISKFIYLLCAEKSP